MFTSYAGSTKNFGTAVSKSSDDVSDAL